jgi:hypothetical protein
MFTLPSAFRGTPAVGYFTHCADKEVDIKSVIRMTRKRNGISIAEAYTGREILKNTNTRHTVPNLRASD